MRSSRRRCRRAAGGAEGEGLEEEAELLLRLLLRDPHHLEDPLLDVAAVDSDRSAADLVAVADDVVRVRERRAGVGVEGVLELLLRRREGVVHRVHALYPRATSPDAVASAAGSKSGASRTQRKLHASSSMRPHRLPISRRAAPSSARDALTAPAAKKMQSPGFAPRVRRGRRARRRCEVLGDRAAELTVLLDEDVGEAAGTTLLGPLLPGVELLARLARAAGHDDRADVVGLEDAEGGVLEEVGALDELVAEAQVGLVGAVAGHASA